MPERYIKNKLFKQRNYFPMAQKYSSQQQTATKENYKILSNIHKNIHLNVVIPLNYTQSGKIKEKLKKEENI